MSKKKKMPILVATMGEGKMTGVQLVGASPLHATKERLLVHVGLRAKVQGSFLILETAVEHIISLKSKFIV